MYGVLPQDRWFQLELGLHSQAGPGVKRGFAFLIDGDFYGWYHAGRMQSETYDRAAVGVLDTNANKPLEVFVDEWAAPGATSEPTGPDNRTAFDRDAAGIIDDDASEPRSTRIERYRRVERAARYRENAIVPRSERHYRH